jgi:hypothetical protein
MGWDDDTYYRNDNDEYYDQDDEDSYYSAEEDNSSDEEDAQMAEREEAEEAWLKYTGDNHHQEEEEREGDWVENAIVNYQQDEEEKEIEVDIERMSTKRKREKDSNIERAMVNYRKERNDNRRKWRRTEDGYPTEKEIALIAAGKEEENGEEITDGMEGREIAVVSDDEEPPLTRKRRKEWTEIEHLLEKGRSKKFHEEGENTILLDGRIAEELKDLEERHSRRRKERTEKLRKERRFSRINQRIDPEEMVEQYIEGMKGYMETSQLPEKKAFDCFWYQSPGSIFGTILNGMVILNQGILSYNSIGIKIRIMKIIVRIQVRCLYLAFRNDVPNAQSYSAGGVSYCIRLVLDKQCDGLVVNYPDIFFKNSGQAIPDNTMNISNMETIGNISRFVVLQEWKGDFNVKPRIANILEAVVPKLVTLDVPTYSVNNVASNMTVGASNIVSPIVVASGGITSAPWFLTIPSYTSQLGTGAGGTNDINIDVPTHNSDVPAYTITTNLDVSAFQPVWNTWEIYDEESKYIVWEMPFDIPIEYRIGNGTRTITDIVDNNIMVTLIESGQSAIYTNVLPGQGGLIGNRLSFNITSRIVFED